MTFIEHYRTTLAEVASYTAEIEAVEARISECQARIDEAQCALREHEALLAQRDAAMGLAFLGQIADGDFESLEARVKHNEPKAEKARRTEAMATAGKQVLEEQRQKILEKRDPLRSTLPGIVHQIVVEKLDTQTAEMDAAARAYVASYERWLALLRVAFAAATSSGVEVPCRPMDLAPVTLTWNLRRLDRVQPDQRLVEQARDALVAELRDQGVSVA